jgi:long-chain acyl-CoA synthetase
MSLISPALIGQDPDAIAVRDEQTALSWRDLDRLMDRTVHALQQIDWPVQRRLCVFAGNSVETIIAHIAAMQAGVSSVPTSYQLTADETAYILKDSGASVLVVGPETAETGCEAARLAGIETVVGWRCAPRAGLISWEDWTAVAPTHPDDGAAKPLPHLHYTSGTTGRPKGVDTPQLNFTTAETAAEFFAGFREAVTQEGRLTALVVSPMHHAGPLSSIRLLAGGSPVVSLAKFDAEQVLDTIERYKVGFTMMVPTHFKRLLALPAEVREKYDVSSLLHINHTGASCPVDVKRAMIDWLGPIFLEAYGATESGATNVITSEEWLKHPGSVGKTTAAFELLVLGDDGERLGANQTGRLFFRDKAGRGIVYRNDPEKTAAAHAAPGVFTLGEVGYFDDDGYVYITDRESDMIVSGGVNIYPFEIESVLITCPGVADICVIGVPNDDFGEEVRALVVPADPQNPPETADLAACCEGKLAKYKRPKSYEFVEDVGRNAMGKVNKRNLRRKYWPNERTIG